MTTTSTEPTSAKDSSSLSSSDLVSRFLAATPSYLYNVPPIQQNFFFSEMLRSFLPLKNDVLSSNNSHVRRRKRSWRDSRDQPLELTTNKKSDCQYHPSTQTSIFQNQHYQHPQSSHAQQYPLSLQNHQHSFDQQLQNSIARTQTRIDNNRILENQTADNVNKHELTDIISIEDSEIEQKKKFIKKYYLERLPLNPSIQPLISSNIDNIKTDEFQNVSTRTNYIEDSLLQYSTKSSVNNTVLYSKNKSDFSTENLFSKIAGSSEHTSQISNLGLANSAASNFPQSQLWHPQYSLSETHSTIDPLHFFIDLRVSGHIWDRNTSEKNIFSRSKHSSAFNVPNSKECNRPLNLTRNESTLIRSLNKSTKGTHHILTNIKHTYQRIWAAENPRNNAAIANFNDVIPLLKSKMTILLTNVYCINL